jgi:hypothetical protein
MTVPAHLELEKTPSHGSRVTCHAIASCAPVVDALKGGVPPRRPGGPTCGLGYRSCVI